MKKAFLLLALLAAGSSLMAQKSGAALLIRPQPLTFITADTTLKSPTLTDLTKMPEASVLKNLTSLRNLNVTPIDETKLIGPMEGYLMPIAVLPGKSNMPVIKLGGNYNMPVWGKPGKKQQITIVP